MVRRKVTSFQWVMGTLGVLAGGAVPLLTLARARKWEVREWAQFTPTVLFLVMIGAVVAFALRWRFVSRRRDRWEMEGRCVRCGYDRSTLRTEVKCPECGAGWRDFERGGVRGGGDVRAGED